VLARRIQQLYPGLKILLTTGYTENAIERADENGQEFEVLSKPYLPNVLAGRVRRILDGPTGVS
jgi:hypothetical protein